MDIKDFQDIYTLIERVPVTGKEVELVYKLKLKIINILKAAANIPTTPVEASNPEKETSTALESNVKTES